MANLFALLLYAFFFFASFPASLGAPAGSTTMISSFAVPKSPSGMFYYEQDSILWVLCGTNTNGDHYLYGYTLAGEQKCFITIPASVGMSRVDGFHIVGAVNPKVRLSSFCIQMKLWSWNNYFLTLVIIAIYLSVYLCIILHIYLSNLFIVLINNKQ